MKRPSKMGIEHFSDFLKKHAPNCLFEVPMESLRGKRIAIDISNLAYIMMKAAANEIVNPSSILGDKPDLAAIHRLTLDNIIQRLEIFLRYGITPVCVFDGKPHTLKAYGCAKRNKIHQQNKEKLALAEQKLYSTEPLFRNQYLLDEYAKYYKQDIKVGRDFSQQLRDILITVGFPVISPDDEPFCHMETRDAEGFCATLCMPGNDYCFATFSTDSDYHVYGGNIEILEVYAKYSTSQGVRTTTHYAKTRLLESILQQSGFSFETFRDLCILMGTDFNPNIPRVGEVGSYNKIKQYGSIANLSQVMDISILRYPEVLKIFASTIIKVDIPPPNFNITLFREHGRNTFDLHDLRDHATIISDLLPNLTQTETKKPISTITTETLFSVDQVINSVAGIEL